MRLAELPFSQRQRVFVLSIEQTRINQRPGSLSARMGYRMYVYDLPNNTSPLKLADIEFLQIREKPNR
jgi:hypothetical protein